MPRWMLNFALRRLSEMATAIRIKLADLLLAMNPALSSKPGRSSTFTQLELFNFGSPEERPERLKKSRRADKIDQKKLIAIQ